MPGFTPDGQRAHYRIYDGKARVDSISARTAIASAMRTCGPKEDA